MGEAPLRALPSTDRILRDPRLQPLLDRFARDAVVRLVRVTLEQFRAEVSAGADPPDEAQVADQVVRRVRAEWSGSPRPVINATGVILHTNLGRAPLGAAALDAVSRVAGYSDLEVELQSGRRGSRQQHVGPILRALTGAEASHVASNGAAGITLALAALARGKEVIVSRGQAVEIGGGFRIPDVLRQSGARLVDVGTTNRTRLRDYAEAISGRTAAILHVHRSNFRILGFAEDAELSELASLAHERGLVLVDDNGSGALLDTAQFGLAHEPTPIESLQSGADVVVFSGDKLLGGPQAGIILGRREPLQRIGRHPLARATRPDKLALAALGGTLLTYLHGDAASELPLWKMIAQPRAVLLRRATSLSKRAAESGLDLGLLDGESTVGGGSLPGQTLPTVLLVAPRTVTAAALRLGRIPVVPRTQGGRVLLDLRTVSEARDEELLEALVSAAASVVPPKNTVLDSTAR